MQGKIKTFVHDKGFGFIKAEGQSDDVFFHISSVNDKSVRCIADEPVEFEATESTKRPGTIEAINIRLAPGHQHAAFHLTGHPSSYLLQWGFIQMDDIDSRGTRLRTH